MNEQTLENMDKSLRNFNVDLNVFDPWKFAKISEEGKYYIPINIKKIWFRTKFPEGNIRYTVLEKDENHVAVEARVYMDRNDAADAYIGYGYYPVTARQVYSNDFMTPYERILGMQSLAMGKAASRALSDAGFGLQSYIDDIDPDKGVSSNNAAETLVADQEKNTSAPDGSAVPSKKEDKGSPEKEPEDEEQPEKSTVSTLKRVRLSMKKNKPEATMTQPDKPVTPVANSPVDTSSAQESTASSSQTATTESKLALLYANTSVMDLEDAKNIRVDSGRYYNKIKPEESSTLWEIATSAKPTTLLYCFERAKSDKVRSAIKTIVENDVNLRTYFFSKF